MAYSDYNGGHVIHLSRDGSPVKRVYRQKNIVFGATATLNLWLAFVDRTYKAYGFDSCGNPSSPLLYSEVCLTNITLEAEDSVNSDVYVDSVELQFPSINNWQRDAEKFTIPINSNIDSRLERDVGALTVYHRNNGLFYDSCTQRIFCNAFDVTTKLSWNAEYIGEEFYNGIDTKAVRIPSFSAASQTSYGEMNCGPCNYI